MTHYMDDFLFAGRARANEHEGLLWIFQMLTGELGIPLTDEKTEGPESMLMYLVIELNMV